MSQQPIRVLLVDDDAEDALFTRQLLAKSKEEEIETTWVDTIEAGMLELKAGAHHLLLLDLGLDGAEGLDSFRAMRSRFPEFPIVVLTSCNDRNLAREAVTLGAQDYLVKSDITTDSLARSLRYALERQRALAQQRGLLEDLQNANSELEQKNRRLAQVVQTAQQFVDNVSHEFRTPLTVIKEYCSMTREGFAGPVTDKQSNFLGTALTRIDDLSIMVDDMLDISRLEAGLLRVWRRRNDVASIFDHIRPALSRRAESGDVHLEFQITESLPAIFCDAEKVGRVLINLIVNACKFTPAGGSIRVSAHYLPQQEAVEFVVADTGRGMCPEDLAVICERFKQVGGELKQSTQGFGLGLNIAKQLIELNFGEINIESQSGKGSTFRFTTPTDNANALFARVRNASDQQAITCLIAEVATDGGFDPSPVVDQFLQAAFGALDIVYMVGPGRWLIASRRDSAAALNFLEEVHESWNEENRNRPAGPLPPLEITICDDARTEQMLREPMALADVTPTDDVTAHPPRRRVLLIDDQIEIVEALALRMQAVGYDVATADSGKRGIEMAKVMLPDAIILDVRMPEMNGMEALSELKQDQRTSSIPVLMLSASLIDQQRALEEGARFFLAKPYDAKTVLTAVETSLA